MNAMSRRESLVAAALGYVCEHGFAGLSLRPLAAAIGTSDRMLIYHFGSREQLVSAILETASLELQTLFRQAFSSARVSPHEVLEATRKLSQQTEARALLELLVQVTGLAAQGEEPYFTASREIYAGWRSWLSERLQLGQARSGKDDADHRERDAVATGLLMIVDGYLIQMVLGHADDASESIEWLQSLLPPT